MTTISNLISAARPKTLPASIGPVILGLGLAYNITSQINFLTASITCMCAVMLQISTNLVNDYYDGIRGIDDEDRLGPKRATSTGSLSKRIIKSAFIMTLILSFALGIYLMLTAGLPIIIIGCLSILFAYIYTGGPFPLSYYALGEILALIFFGPVAVWGTYYIQTHEHNNLAIFIGLAPGFIAAAIMAINNLRDRSTDINTKKITLAIIMGKTGARLLPVTLVLFSTFVPVIHISVLKGPQTVLMSLFTSYLFTRTWLSIMKDPIDERFNIHLASTGKYLFIFCLTYSLCLVYAA